MQLAVLAPRRRESYLVYSESTFCRLRLPRLGCLAKYCRGMRIVLCIDVINLVMGPQNCVSIGGRTAGCTGPQLSALWQPDRSAVRQAVIRSDRAYRGSAASLLYT